MYTENEGWTRRGALGPKEESFKIVPVGRPRARVPSFALLFRPEGQSVSHVAPLYFSCSLALACCMRCGAHGTSDVFLILLMMMLLLLPLSPLPAPELILNCYSTGYSTATQLAAEHSLQQTCTSFLIEHPTLLCLVPPLLTLRSFAVYSSSLTYKLAAVPMSPHASIKIP